VLDSSSISLWLKNELNIFPSKEIHEKGEPTLRWVVSEPLTLNASINWVESLNTQLEVSEWALWSNQIFTN